MPDESGRKKKRMNVRFRTQFSGRRISGTGTVKNISESGALIEDADPLLVAGGRIRLRFSFYDGSLPIEVGALVVRTTEAGFGVRFTGLDERLRALLAISISKLNAPVQDATGVPGAEDPDEDITLMRVRRGGS